MKYQFILLGLIFLSFSIGAETPPRNCFEEHLKDAIAINKARKDRYAVLSHGKSKKISNILIFAEKFSLMTAKRADKKVRKYHAAGMTILCDELITLKKVPPFNDYVLPVGPMPEKFPSAKPGKLKRKIRRALKKEGFEGVVKVVAEKLKELDKRPTFNCLMKNDLRTILLTAQNAPIHIQKAEELGLSSPRRISTKLIKQMTSALTFVNWFDRMAFPLQKKGIAIICQDFVGAKK